MISQNNLTLYEDTVKKSPNFAPPRIEYGIALAESGNRKEAIKQFEMASKMSGNEMVMELASMNLINMSEPQINITEPQRKLLGLQNKTELEAQRQKYIALSGEKTSPRISRKIIENIISKTEMLILAEKNPDKLRVLHKEIITYIEQRYKLDSNAFYLYKQGQYYLALGEKEKAAELFRKTIELSPNEYYSEPARKLIKKLESEINN